MILPKVFVSFLYWPNSHCDSLEHVHNWVHAIRCLSLETYSLSESNAGQSDGSSITIGQPSDEGRRHLKILKNRFSETFPAFLRDLGTKMLDFHKYGFFTTVGGRRVSDFKCGSDLHDAGHLGSMYFFSAFNSPASVDE